MASKGGAMAWLQRVATGRAALIAVLVYVVFSLVFFNLGPVPAMVETANAPLLDTRFAWGGDDARHFLATLGEEGRRLYALVLLIDTLYVLTFAVTGALLLAWLSSRVLNPRSLLRWVSLLPVTAGVLDLIENAGILALLGLFPTVPAALGTTLGFITAAKLMLVNLSTALVILGLVIVAILAVLNRRRRATR
jgi:hypothetical protein